MYPNEQKASLETLQEIRNIMTRSARFLSLSGWSGIWAGGTALAGAAIAYKWLEDIKNAGAPLAGGAQSAAYDYDNNILRFISLALTVLVVAIGGGYYFTYRNAQKDGQKIWNKASRQLVANMVIPLLAGGIFAFSFLYNDQSAAYIAPVCLVFYGLALINGSKYTLSDIRYLGLCEVALGCISLFLPGYGLFFWSFGFGVLHIFYGSIMWNKYERTQAK